MPVDIDHCCLLPNCTKAAEEVKGGEKHLRAFLMILSSGGEGGAEKGGELPTAPTGLWLISLYEAELSRDTMDGGIEAKHSVGMAN